MEGSPCVSPSSKESLHINKCEELQDRFARLLESGKYSDVTFVIMEGSFEHRVPAHRMILASQSDDFHQLLFVEKKEAHEIHLEDTPLKAFLLLLQYAYTGRVQIASNLKLVLDLTTLAHRYNITSLKDFLDMHLSVAVNESNVIEIFVHADLVDLEKAYSTAAALIDRKPTHILANPRLLSLPSHNLRQILSRSSFMVAERYVFQAVQRWMQRNNKTPKEAADVLQCVRLCEITPEYLFSDVEPSGLFEEAAIVEAVRIRCKPQWDCTQPRGIMPAGNLFETEEAHAQYSVVMQPKWDIHSQGTMKVVSQVSRTFPFKAVSNRLPQSLLVRFDSRYLVNAITLQIHQPTSYIVRISADNSCWRKLIDYSQFICRGKQRLLFPQQAVRYLQLTPLNQREGCLVTLGICCYRGDASAIIFKENGIIGPLNSITPCPIVQNTPSSFLYQSNPACSVKFNQPYSINCIRLKLHSQHGFADSDVYDVSVLVNGSEIVAELQDIEFGSEIVAEFPELVVLEALVVLKSPSTQATKKVKVETEEDGPIDVESLKAFAISSLRVSFETATRSTVN